MAHNPTFRIVKEGTTEVQQPERAKQARYSKTDLRYWETVVYHRTYRRYEKTFQIRHLSTRIRHLGRQEIFTLHTNNKTAAASRAREIYLYLLANGWEATNAKYKPAREKQTPHNAVRTIGELIAQIKAHNHSSGRTLEEYIRNLRRLVAGVFGIEGGKAKYDYRAGGRDQWLARVDSVTLESITPVLIQKWKTHYLSRAGAQPRQTARGEN
jgi:hypothetical protein